MSTTRQSQLHRSYRQIDNKNGFQGQTISSPDILKLTAKPCAFCGEIEKERGCRRIDKDGPHSFENCLPCCLSCTRRGTKMTDKLLTLKSTMESLKGMYDEELKRRQTTPQKARVKLPPQSRAKLPPTSAYIDIDRGGVRSDECVIRRGGEAPPRSFLGGPKMTHSSVLIAATAQQTEQKTEDQKEEQTTEEEQPPTYQGFESEQPVPEKWFHLWMAAKIARDDAIQEWELQQKLQRMADDTCNAHQSAIAADKLRKRKRIEQPVAEPPRPRVWSKPQPQIEMGAEELKQPEPEVEPEPERKGPSHGDVREDGKVYSAQTGLWLKKNNWENLERASESSSKVPRKAA